VALLVLVCVVWVCGQSSCTSTDANDLLAVQCPQHGSGLNIVDVIKDNIEAQSAPMLTALCNDPSLRSSCTCHHADTPATCARRQSLSHSRPMWVTSDQRPGSVARPYSWASETGSGGQHWFQYAVTG